MSSPPDFKRILREDLKEAPGWIDKLITPINQFFEQTQSLFNGQLTVGDNVAGGLVKISFSTPADYTTANGFTPVKFTWSRSGSMNAILIGKIAVSSGNYTVMTKPVSLDWRQLDVSTGQVNFITGLEPSTKYTATLVVL